MATGTGRVPAGPSLPSGHCAQPDLQGLASPGILPVLRLCPWRAFQSQSVQAWHQEEGIVRSHQAQNSSELGHSLQPLTVIRFLPHLSL